MADLFDVSMGGAGWHITSHIIAIAALFVACFAIAGYITFRDDSVPGSALKDQDVDLDDIDAATLTLSGDATIGGTLSAYATDGVEGSLRKTDRYYLREYFVHRPALNGVLNTAFTNASASDSSTTDIRLAEKVANRNFEVLGTNMTTALVTFSTDSAGITLTTAGADEDQAIIAPHLDTNQTAWTGTKWGTQNQVEWECMIRTNAIDNQKVWAGLKLTNDQLVATDDDQAYFKFQTDGDNSETFTDFTKLHFVYSVGGTDYISQLPITVEANTNYHLKIQIDSSRKVAIFVNGTQYNLTSTSGSTGGTAVTAGTTRSLALTGSVDLIPYIGIEAGAAAAESLDVAYEAISRKIFE